MPHLAPAQPTFVDWCLGNALLAEQHMLHWAARLADEGDHLPQARELQLRAYWEAQIDAHYWLRAAITADRCRPLAAPVRATYREPKF